MEFLGRVVEWFADPVHWSGSTGIPVRLLEHLYISLLSVALAAAVAVPIGMYIGHTRRAEFLVVSMTNLGRAIPSFAILGFAFIAFLPLGLAFSVWPTAVALFFLAVPPIVTNTYVGVQNVDPDILEAARGVGMTERDVLFGLELRLAAPLIVAGLRTAAVQVVATATLAAVVAWGGLGRFIIDGFAARDFPQVFAGAFLVASLALATELSFVFVGRAVTPLTSSREPPQMGVPEPVLGSAA